MLSSYHHVAKCYGSWENILLVAPTAPHLAGAEEVDRGYTVLFCSVDRGYTFGVKFSLTTGVTSSLGAGSGTVLRPRLAELGGGDGDAGARSNLGILSRGCAQQLQSAFSRTHTQQRLVFATPLPWQVATLETKGVARLPQQ